MHTIKLGLAHSTFDLSQNILKFLCHSANVYFIAVNFHYRSIMRTISLITISVSLMCLGQTTAAPLTRRGAEHTSTKKPSINRAVESSTPADTLQPNSQERSKIEKINTASNENTDSSSNPIQTKPKSIFKKRTKRWNANLLALTLFDQSPEFKRPRKVNRSRPRIWAYDFGGGVWGRRKREVKDFDFEFRFNFY